MDKFAIVSKDINSTVSTIDQLILAKSYSSSQLHEISNRFSSWRSFKAFIDPQNIENLVNNGDISYHRIVGEMIRYDVQEFGGNGLGYRSGVKFFYTNSSGNVLSTHTILTESELQLYVQQGKYTNYTHFEGHHINYQADPNYAKYRYDVDNLVLVDQTFHDGIANNANQKLPLIKNVQHVRNSFGDGNFKLLMIGSLLSLLMGFVFGYIAYFIVELLLYKKRTSQIVNGSVVKALLKPALKYGLISAVIGGLFSIITGVLLLLAYAILGIEFTEISLQYFAILLYTVLGLLIGIGVCIKNRGGWKKTLLSVLGVGVLYFLISFPSLLFSGGAKIIGWVIILSLSIIVRYLMILKSNRDSTVTETNSKSNA
jgi:hypothetical protein